MTEDFVTDDMLDQVRYCANRVARKYPVTADDLYQEGIVWLFSHPGSVSNWINDTDENGNTSKRGWGRFTRSVEAAMVKVARAEKAARAGYDPDDEAYYYIAMIELVLPALWDESLRVLGPKAEGRESSNGGDPAESGTWAAMVVDVEKAWKAADLDVRERTMLRMRYGSGAIFSDIARAYECSLTKAADDIKRALRKMQRELGGAKPAYCDTSCPECGPGSRHAISNAQARWITEVDYDV